MGRIVANGSTRLIFVGLLVMLMAAEPAGATVHVVKFGGTVGLAYSPSSLSVAVGDTIRWQGDFSFHPLSSTTIPAGATAWSKSSATSFDYAVTVPGQYFYVCDVHQPSMSGSFTAVLSSVAAGQGAHFPNRFSLEQNYPNPFNPTTSIRYGVGVVSRDGVAAARVRLAVYDVLGREVAVLVDGQMPAGEHQATFDATGLASGVYVYQLTAADLVQTRTMMLLR